MNQFDWVCYRGYSGTRRRTRTETYYDTQVKYEYIVKNVTFSSDKISHVKIDTTCRDCAYAVRNKYNKGSVVPVHYHPEQPDEAVLEAGLQARTFLPLSDGNFRVHAWDIIFTAHLFWQRNARQGLAGVVR